MRKRCRLGDGTLAKICIFDHSARGKCRPQNDSKCRTTERRDPKFFFPDKAPEKKKGICDIKSFEALSSPLPRDYRHRLSRSLLDDSKHLEIESRDLTLSEPEYTQI